MKKAMPSKPPKSRTCPLCKEEIKPDALKCRHCLTILRPPFPEHKGICPFCKESIKPNAIRCKHCKSNLSGSRFGCGCGGSKPLIVRRGSRAMPLPGRAIFLNDAPSRPIHVPPGPEPGPMIGTGPLSTTVGDGWVCYEWSDISICEPTQSEPEEPDWSSGG